MAQKESPEIQLPIPNQKLWTVNFVLICLSNLVVFMSFHSLLPTLPIYIQNLGGSKSTAGLALGFIMISAIILRPLAGWFLDNYGRKFILVVGLVVFLVPSMVYVTMVSIIPLLILRLIQGIGWGVCTTAQGTVAADIIPPKRLGEGLGYFSLTISLSLAIAPAMGLWLIDKFSFQHLFAACSVLTFLSLLFALSVKYPKRVNPITKSKLVLFEKDALRPAMVALMLGLTYSALLSFVALFVLQQGLTTAGWFFTVMAVTSMLARPMAGNLVDLKGRRGYDAAVATGMISMILCLLVLAQTSATWHLVVSGLLFGIGFGFLQPTMMALCINSVPSNRKGGATATFWFAYDIGVGTGSIGWGFVASILGYSAMFLLNIIPAVIGLLIYFLHKKPVST